MTTIKDLADAFELVPAHNGKILQRFLHFPPFTLCDEVYTWFEWFDVPFPHEPAHVRLGLYRFRF